MSKTRSCLGFIAVTVMLALIGVASAAPASTKAASESGAPIGVGEEVRTASGALFRVDRCGTGYGQSVYGVVPRSLDLKTSTPSKRYTKSESVGGIFDVISEAIEFYFKLCNIKDRRIEPKVYLFAERLPAPPNNRGIYDFAGMPFVNINRGGDGGWNIENGVADLAKKQEQKRREQEVAQQKQAQAAAQQAQDDAKRSGFLRQYSAVEIPNLAILESNPFSLEGKTIGLFVTFHQMTSATEGRFDAYDLKSGIHQTVVLSEIPKGTFLEPTRAFIAAKVVGLTQIQGFPVKVPLLKFVGVAICANPKTSCP